MTFQFDDGGRGASGRKGFTGDCVARSIAIASGRPYAEVYDRLAEGNMTQRIGRRRNGRASGKRTASHGIQTQRQWFKDLMSEWGFVWRPTMGIGTGCKVHLQEGELPTTGRYVVALSKHMTALVENVIRDTYDPRREGFSTFWYKPGTTEVQNVTWTGGRCVYGYWELRA